MKSSIILAVLFLIILSSITVVHATQQPKVLPAKVVIPTPTYLQLVNQARVVDGEQPLTENEELDASAKDKACDMRDNNYFDHKDLKGQWSWHLFNEEGYYYQYAGENLAIGYTSNVATFNAWMASPEHRDNILDPHFTEVGTGVCGDYTVQHFGTPYD